MSMAFAPQELHGCDKSLGGSGSRMNPGEEKYRRGNFDQRVEVRRPTLFNKAHRRWFPVRKPGTTKETGRWILLKKHREFARGDETCDTRRTDRGN
jgi:hypothetical protein